LHSSRRQEEITRLKRTDLEREKGIASLDDVKHPRHKKGNRRSFRLLPEAWEIIDRQPVKGDLIFPFKHKSISAAFTRSCKLLGIKNLRFHDLRHEATSRLFERGYAIQEVQQFTLHESWTTLKRYTHLRPERVPNRVSAANGHSAKAAELPVQEGLRLGEKHA
jgi:integrase